MLYLDFLDKLYLGYMKDLMNTLSSALFFMLKKFVRNRSNFHITYYSSLIRVIHKVLGPRTSIFKYFLPWIPTLCHINFLPNQRGKIKQTQK